MSLPPGTLQTLIRRYQRAREKMEELAREVGAALALPGQAAPVVAAPARRATRNGVDQARDANGQQQPWRRNQIVAAIRKHGQTSVRELVRMVPGLTEDTAYVALSTLIKERALVRTAKGVYAVADSPRALPAILKQAIKGKRKPAKTPTPMRRQGRGGRASKQQQIMDLAEKQGGMITAEDVIKAGISSKLKLAGQLLLRGVKYGRLVRYAPGKYATPDKARGVLKKLP